MSYSSPLALVNCTHNWPLRVYVLGKMQMCVLKCKCVFQSAKVHIEKHMCFWSANVLLKCKCVFEVQMWFCSVNVLLKYKCDFEVQMCVSNTNVCFQIQMCVCKLEMCVSNVYKQPGHREIKSCVRHLSRQSGQYRMCTVPRSLEYFVLPILYLFWFNSLAFVRDIYTHMTGGQEEWGEGLGQLGR